MYVIRAKHLPICYRQLFFIEKFRRILSLYSLHLQMFGLFGSRSLFVPLQFLFAYSYSRFPVYFATLLFSLFLILDFPEYLYVGIALILFCAPIFSSSPRKKSK